MSDDPKSVNSITPEAESEPLSLLDRVLRNHPGLTREEASEMLIAFGASPNDDVRRIHAWRRKQLPAYQRTPADSNEDLRPGSPEHTP